MRHTTYWVILILAVLAISCWSSMAQAQALAEYNRGLALAANPATRAQARDAFVRAKGLAISEQNVNVLLNLSQQQLALRDEAEAVHCYDQAAQLSYDMANPDPAKPGTGTNCRGGFTGLAATVTMWTTLRVMPMNRDSAGLLFATAQRAFNNADKIRREGCPPAGFAGTWTIRQTNSGGQVYAGTLILTQSGTYVGGRAAWDNHPHGEITGTIRPPSTLDFAIAYGGGLTGSYTANMNANGLSMGGNCSSNKGGTCTFIANR